MFLLFQALPWNADNRDIGSRAGIFWHFVTLFRMDYGTASSVPEGAFGTPVKEAAHPWNMGDGGYSYQVV